MSKSISITVPADDYNALTRASDMFHGLANDLKNGSETKTSDEVTETIGKITTTIEPVATPAQGEIKTPADTEKAIQENMQTEQQHAAELANDEQNEQTPPPAGVDFDGEGLPWDARIHASSKTKLAKKPNGWKKKRGVDPALVEQVETELKAAMAAPAPAETTEPETTPPPATTETTDNAAAAFSEPAATTETAPPAPAETVEGITTFPAIMSAITAAMTAGDITNEAVQAALQKNGLASLPLLAARPDLIPTIATELGL